jgi:glycosyltransferase involved in cell wall biosynthesis
MRILYHHRIASKDGQYVHVEELTNALIEAGHELHFVCPQFAENTDFGDEGGIATRLKAALPKWIYELLELSYSLLIAAKLIRAIIQFRPDFIYERYNLYQPVGVIIAKLFRLPILMEVNAPLVQERSRYSGLALPRFAKVIENFTWRWSTYALPVTQVLAEHVIEAGVDSDRIVVVPNGINQQVLKDLDKRPDDKKTSDRITIGFTGFIHPWHGLDMALQSIAETNAASGNKKIHFLCVGEGDIRPDLEQQAKDLGIEKQIEFTGLVSRDAVFDYVAQFDIALQPSVTAYASPLKLFEYLAVGALVIAPDMPNIREIISEESALLFEPDKENGFYEQLVFALNHYDELDGMRRAARQLIVDKQLTWQENAAKVASLVEAKR